MAGHGRDHELPTRSRHAATNKPDASVSGLVERLAGKPIVLVGMMGAGKTTVGKRLANALGRRFVDSDAEIETAAGMSIPDIFERHGEDEFRAGEARVIARLLNERDIVLGTGGGAFIQPQTRDLVASAALSVWLKADAETLFARVSRRTNRPLLRTENPRETLQKLIDARYPIYAEADITVNSRDVPHDVVASEIVAALDAFVSNASPRTTTDT